MNTLETQPVEPVPSISLKDVEAVAQRPPATEQTYEQIEENNRLVEL